MNRPPVSACRPASVSSFEKEKQDKKARPNRLHIFPEKLPVDTFVGCWRHTVDVRKLDRLYSLTRLISRSIREQQVTHFLLDRLLYVTRQPSRSCKDAMSPVEIRRQQSKSTRDLLLYYNYTIIRLYKHLQLYSNTRSTIILRCWMSSAP